MIWGLADPIAIEIYQQTNGGMLYRELAIADIFSIGGRGAVETGGWRYIPLTYYGLTRDDNRVVTSRPAEGSGAKWFVRLARDNKIEYYQTETQNGRLTVGKRRKESLQDIRETSAAAPQAGYKDLSDNQLRQLVAVGDKEAAKELEKRVGKESGRPDSQAEAGAGPLPLDYPGLKLIPPKLPDWDFKNLLIAGLVFLVAFGAVVTDRK